MNRVIIIASMVLLSVFSPICAWAAMDHLTTKIGTINIASSYRTSPANANSEIFFTVVEPLASAATCGGLAIPASDAILTGALMLAKNNNSTVTVHYDINLGSPIWGACQVMWIDFP